MRREIKIRVGLLKIKLHRHRSHLIGKHVPQWGPTTERSYSSPVVEIGAQPNQDRDLNEEKRERRRGEELQSDGGEDIEVGRPSAIN